ncbi:ADL237Cp [Eremothecium gossypii ATCC 10895]|uniref:ADL237Cp n=1 Tax=Eremothecium gossypii (strain ATCC 10895 / CBS 109.51 / FGSC 9923 / NRRL Y-1056) TaxID=284811 RepID=Q75B14_EREGS|nr:ADL237Cp [Eremothecium gossypii ATCC 10895]AAS51683.1 ADL237Cp [Eremothecium gossypii ATCC 10895]AEY95980.1 FADL237Cp [Eremothecium gossypii FDAG1]
MFKSVTYSEDKHLTDTDSEVEPHDTSKHRGRRHGAAGSGEESKHVRLDVEGVPGLVQPEDAEEPGELPAFKRRPLSDTPLASQWASPTSSGESSTESTPVLSPSHSSGDLQGLDNKTEARASGNGGLPRVRRKAPTTMDVPGLTRSKTSPDGMISKHDPGSKLVVVMVGLPATGKSFITNKLSRFLNYSFYYCKVFNVGNTRREYGKQHELMEQDSRFFDPSNDEAKALREKWAMDTLNELLDYLLDGPGSVAIFDATNSTQERRRKIYDKIKSRNSQLNVLFLESICSDRQTVEKNIRLKLLGPDYKGKDPELSLRDFKDRLANYVRAYEAVEDSEGFQYIKMIDVGKKVISYNIQGFLASQTVYYLLNFNLAERQIWITRNGESEYNVLGRIGGDSKLTPRGRKYARALAQFIDSKRREFNEHEYEQFCKLNDEGTPTDEFVPTSFYVWTSMLRRAEDTAADFNEDIFPIKQMRMLDELSAGDCEGMTYEEIHQKYPEEFEERLIDKLRYRYRGIGGESYMDVINRLRPVITELERITDNVLIITHRVVARVLLGYFLNLSRDIIANLDVPLHSVYCLEPKPYGITWSLYEYCDETDTFSKVPQTQLNTMKVKEVGLVHNERRYSLVPAAPPTNNSDDIPLQSRNSSGISLPPYSSSSSSTTPSISSGGISVTSRMVPPLRQPPAYQTHPSFLARSKSDDPLTKRLLNPNKHSIELQKLHEKLSVLRANDHISSGDDEDNDNNDINGSEIGGTP